MDAQYAGLLDRYGPALRRLCSVYRRNRADQEDLFQQIGLALWTALPRFRRDASERTWLYRIAHNVALTQSVRGDRKRSREVQAEVKGVAASAPDPRREQLLDAVRRLQPGDRELVLLYLEGFTTSEMAAVLGLSEGNVAVRLTRVRQRLSDMLLDRKETQR